MSNNHHFPIFRSALELCVYIETIVKGFDKYHKYTIGEDMRKFSKDLLFIINRVGLTKYLDAYEKEKGKMGLAQIKKFLSVQASFVSHIQHANSYNLQQKIGVLNEINPFDYDRA